MSLMLLSGPTIEPVTLSELKSYLQINREDEHLFLSASITAARVQIERHTRRQLTSQRWRVVGDMWPGSDRFKLDIAPIISFDDMWLRERTGNWTAFARENFWLDNSSDPGFLVLAGGGRRPAVSVVPSGLAIDLTVGYGESPEDIPAPLREAVKLLAASWFENRANSTSPVVPSHIQQILSPFVRLSL